MGLTSELGTFLSTIRFDDIPEEAVSLVRDAFTDTIGVMMAGIHEPITQIVFNEVAAGPRSPQARACLSEVRIVTSDAALLGGTAAHALDYDDQALTGHPSAVIIPAILAESELLGSSGRDMVTAYVAGYEVWADLIGRGFGYHSKGWHPTSVFGTVAAAAAVAVLHKLPAKPATMALSMAASQSGGLAVNFGTMTKPYHAGMAARGGLLSARLAAAGATASQEAFEHAKGYLTAFSSEMSGNHDAPSLLGKKWEIVSHRLCVKRYPTCYFMHRSFDATAKLLAYEGTKADDIAEVTVTMGKGQTAVLVNERPQTGLQAKFSEQFAMAAAAVLGHMKIDDLTDQVVQRADIQSFLPKVKLVGVDEYDSRDPAHSPSERVLVQLNDGRFLDTGPITMVRGHAGDPLTTAELWEKFRDCTAKTHEEAEARILFEQTQLIPAIASPADLPTARGLFSR